MVVVGLWMQGVERDGLVAHLAPRGLAVAADPGAATLALVTACVVTALPRMVEAVDAAAAVSLLDGGADEVVLASDPDALVAARLTALARRGTTLIVGDLAIDPVARRVTRAGRAIGLRPREYALLLLLARAGGARVAGPALRQALSGTACAPGTNVLAVHLSRLRAAIGAGEARIVTDKGHGYRLIADGGAAR